MCEATKLIDGLLQNAYQDKNISFAGAISPIQAFDLIEENSVQFIDIRTFEERKFVGFPSGSEHIPFSTGTSFQSNPRFIKEVEKKFEKERPVLLICRSGNRSKLAATALTKAGFKYVFNILEGFEGDLNEINQRNQINGWKYRKLPWIQD